MLSHHSTVDRVVVIAEAGVNHNGRLDLALELVDAAADAGADMVKFQAFSAETLASAATPAAEYQKQRAGADSQQAMLRDLELSLDEFRSVAERCDARGIAFLCTPFDADMAEPLIAMGMPAIKIASGELTNHPALRRFGALGRPVYLSTGMARLEEVAAALKILREAGAGEVTVLHCTSLYPAPPETLNLRAIATLAEMLDAPVGYSDHSLGTHMALGAVALGARVIEKHMTLDRTMHGPDHAASLEPGEFRQMTAEIREMVQALGHGRKEPHADETAMAAVARRSWHATRELAAGHVLEYGDAVLLRPGTGLAGSNDPVGRVLVRAVGAGRPIGADDLDSGIPHDSE